MSFANLEAPAQEILRRYEYPRAATLPLLWLAQKDQGYISREAEQWVATLTGQAVAHVREVVSFYNMYRTQRAGRRELRVCTSLPCQLRGSGRLLEQLANVLPQEQFEPRAHDHDDERNLFDRVKDMFG